MFRKLFAIETAALIQLENDDRYGDGRFPNQPGADAPKAAGLPPGFGLWNARTSR